MVILNEMYVQANGQFEIVLVEALKEETTAITENFGLQDQNFWKHSRNTV